jgi:hypothetical protein
LYGRQPSPSGLAFWWVRRIPSPIRRWPSSEGLPEHAAFGVRTSFDRWRVASDVAASGTSPHIGYAGQWAGPDRDLGSEHDHQRARPSDPVRISRGSLCSPSGARRGVCTRGVRGSAGRELDQVAHAGRNEHDEAECREGVGGVDPVRSSSHDRRHCRDLEELDPSLLGVVDFCCRLEEAVAIDLGDPREEPQVCVVDLWLARCVWRRFCAVSTGP